MTPNGVIGDPSHASAAKGERLLEAASDAIAELITDSTNWTDRADLRGNGTGKVPFLR